MYKALATVIVVSALNLTGCSTVPNSNQGILMGNLLLAEPAPASIKSQRFIARYNQILAKAPLKNEERAELLYQRGTLYDSVGLSGLAQHDFSQAIQLKPDLAEAHNSIGVHYTQQEEFIQAYESFDATLDINPDFDFAFLNRGIALYYGGRPDLAVKDLTTFYEKDASDPYRALWHFIAQRDLNLEEAQVSLRKLRNALDENNWATSLVDLYLGDISESQLLNNLVRGVSSHQQLTDRLCEAYFYLGKYHSAKGNRGVASTYFKLALSTNVYDYVEHRYARLELSLLREKSYKEARAQ